MVTWCRKFVLLLALAVMPLQGVAATLTILLCHGDAQTHALHGPDIHTPGAHHAGHEQENDATGNDDGGAIGNSYHLCCSLTASAPPPISFDAELPDLPVQAFVPDPLYDLFAPEQPQRPPLA